ncbi:MAG: NUDIX domain-containing protein [Caulobacteraceae bacterium]|nr:NUDIX domain-containing protein [Caulobacteraceae bacterium]
MTDDTPIHIQAVESLYDGWASLKSVRFDYRRRDGGHDILDRLIFDSGDAAAVLPYDAARGVVLLARQFRLPPHLAGRSGFLLEACAGKLDGDDAETCARREAEEELGYRLGPLERLFEAFMSPGALTEQVVFFLAPYSPADRISDGGGHPHEGEDIEVVETPFADALAMIARGEIIDAKTIMLLQQLKLSGHLAG